MDTRYPIGKFERPEKVGAAEREKLVGQLKMLPFQLRRMVNHLGDAQLDTPYREGGWTIRQVIHHLPDSHMNAYVRLKLALTEENPPIKPYNEAAWATLPDASKGPIDVSLELLQALHARWVETLLNLSEAQWQRTFQHPELGAMSIETQLALYAWHGRHHLAHIENAL